MTICSSFPKPDLEENHTMRMRSASFFATRGDLASVLEVVERHAPIDYVECGLFEARDRPVLTSWSQLPQLGEAVSGDHNLEPFWLIMHHGQRLQVEPIAQRTGEVKYNVDPASNPDSVVLWPGGVFGQEAVISGQVATKTPTPASLALWDVVESQLREQFKRIRAFRVGREAERLLDTGYRLTSHIKGPVECDLSR